MSNAKIWLGALLAGALLQGSAGAASPRDLEVDVELVLAVDVSYSMDVEEQALQREGYASALTSREFLDALRQGLNGRIAIAYIEWAGENEQQIVVNWRVVDGPETAQAYADAIREAPLRRVYRTSISSALLYSADQFDLNGYAGVRRVIDVSGDGVNNQGPPVALARDSVVKRGITINGLPLLLKRSASSAIDVPELDFYYEDCVIGGPGAFVIPVQHREEFARAIKTKLVLEVAGVRVPDAAGPIRRVADAAPRISCTIGEKIWMEHWSN
ncbi:DUF1194 domain-containing protein [Xanthobacter pseudotagetidis]|uniref:DUF1194 domain-containing protein n=1 Tax=Xanthobacter pseudotagetidis TaxID=3119911 RepID=UPI00372A79D6